MWVADDETPLTSPTREEFTVPWSTPAHKEAKKKDNRSTKFYDDILRKRERVAHRSDEEREYGWGGAAAEMRDASAESPASTPSVVSPTAPDSRAPATILGQISPEDLPQPPMHILESSYFPDQAGSTLPQQNKNQKLKLGARLRGMSCTSPDSHFDTSNDKPSGFVSASQMSTIRRAASHKDLQKNKTVRAQKMSERGERGSIMYDPDSELAQIPLFSAPATAHMSSAPALSSFAPRRPLADKNESRKSWQMLAGSSPKAGASATVDAEGGILEIKKAKKAYDKGSGRFSTFMRSRSSVNLA